VQNFATQTKRPPGSALKPISVYAPALERGIINWASVYDDVPVEFNSGGNMVWPRNATGVYRGLTNISYAVAHSTNTVAVRVLQELGLDESYRFANERFHLSGMVSEVGANDRDLAALALGQLNYGVTLRELTTAYTVFADRGVYHPYRSYYRVLDGDGRVLLSRADASEVVLSEGNAAIMTKLLQGVVDYGTSSSITLKNRVECAGKTGTTNADGDRWFVGYTPELICGVWCGYEYPEPLEGRNLCTTIWNRVMSDIVEEKGGKDRFDVPQNVIRASYCKDSGKLLSDACGYDARGNRSEIGWFLKENMPTAFCDCHVLCDYDADHGGISHGNCPDSFLKKVALIKAERRFPVQIYVSDAQYVYRGDPLSINPNENEKQPYFANEVIGYYGASPAEHPFNRSCKIHLYPPDDAWDYLIPRFYETEEE
jgi:penicillin-binding protein 1A